MGKIIGVFVGLAARYERVTRNEVRYSDGAQRRETIRRGAFRGADLAGCVGCVNHNRDAPLGRLGRGLQLEEVYKGLRFHLAVPDIEAGRALVRAWQAGEVSGASFAAEMNRRPWGRTGGYFEVTQVRKVADVALITGGQRPAYPQTQKHLRFYPAGELAPHYLRWVEGEPAPADPPPAPRRSAPPDPIFDAFDEQLVGFLLVEHMKAGARQDRAGVAVLEAYMRRHRVPLPTAAGPRRGQPVRSGRPGVEVR